jgi:putative glutamine amidotransferase
MTRKIAAISQRRDLTAPPHDEVRDALDVRLAAFVLAAGGWPVPVPSALGTDHAADWMKALNIGAVILGGGGDIGADTSRDSLETALLAQCAHNRLPVLGICRGMQMLAHVAGTQTTTRSGHVASRHKLSGMGDREVNSFHQQILESCPGGYSTIAKAPDGSIEAIRNTTLPWEGWMWHPEREPDFHPSDIDRLKGLLT